MASCAGQDHRLGRLGAARQPRHRRAARAQSGAREPDSREPNAEHGSPEGVRRARRERAVRRLQRTGVARRRVSRRHAHAVDQHQRRRRRPAGAAQGRHRRRRAGGREAHRVYVVRQRRLATRTPRSPSTTGARSASFRTAASRGRCCATRSTRTASSIKPCRSCSDGALVTHTPDARVAYVTREDCAAAAAAVLATPGHENKAYNITGPDAIGPRELVALASEISGKRVELVVLSEADYRRRLAAVRHAGRRDQRHDLVRRGARLAVPARAEHGRRRAHGAARDERAHVADRESRAAARRGEVE